MNDLLLFASGLALGVLIEKGTSYIIIFVSRNKHPQRTKTHTPTTQAPAEVIAMTTEREERIQKQLDEDDQ